MTDINKPVTPDSNLDSDNDKPTDQDDGALLKQASPNNSSEILQVATEPSVKDQDAHQLSPSEAHEKPKEINGPKGLEPTRYGDWESKGRCYDF